MLEAEEEKVEEVMLRGTGPGLEWISPQTRSNLKTHSATVVVITLMIRVDVNLIL